MFRHQLLGLLRDGQLRHGYELMTEYRARSGNHVSTGNFYRELARLAADRLVQTGVNPPEADARRIPYQITDHGRQIFDQWLTGRPGPDEEISARLLFVDQVPPDVLGRLLDRWQEELWVRGKELAREREDALADRPPDDPAGRYSPLPSLLSRRMKHVAAELEFIKEFRLELDAWTRRRAEANARRAGSTGAGRGGAREDRGDKTDRADRDRDKDKDKGKVRR